MTVNQRSCLPCTACCEGWLDIDEETVQAHLDSPCVHCSSQGCAFMKTVLLTHASHFFVNGAKKIRR